MWKIVIKIIRNTNSKLTNKINKLYFYKIKLSKYRYVKYLLEFREKYIRTQIVNKFTKPRNTRKELDLNRIRKIT